MKLSRPDFEEAVLNILDQHYNGFEGLTRQRVKDLVAPASLAWAQLNDVLIDAMEYMDGCVHEPQTEDEDLE